MLFSSTLLEKVYRIWRELLATIICITKSINSIQLCNGFYNINHKRLGCSSMNFGIYFFIPIYVDDYMVKKTLNAMLMIIVTLNAYIFSLKWFTSCIYNTKNDEKTERQTELASILFS